MRGSLEHPPIVILIDRRKRLLHLLVVALLAALMSPLARTDWTRNGLAWMAIAIFGSLAAAAVWELIAPGRLIIDEDGFEMRDLWWRRRWSWREARGFYPANNRFHDFVGFDSLGGPWGRRPRRRSRVDGINQDWELAPPALAALLNRARARWLAG
jgi:hypothetical protein